MCRVRFVYLSDPVRTRYSRPLPIWAVPFVLTFSMHSSMTADRLCLPIIPSVYTRSVTSLDSSHSAKVIVNVAFYFTWALLN